MQELLATLLRRGRGLREAESKYRWLCRAADRSCLDLLRRTRRSREALDIDEIDSVGVAPGMSAEDRRAVLQSLERLDPDQQSLAIMLFVDGMTQGEAAAELGVSRVTVNKRAQELRDVLQRVEREPTGVATEARP